MYEDKYISKLNARKYRNYFTGPGGVIHIDYADELKDAAWYIGSNLTAKKPVTVYSSPGGTVLRTVQPGGYVGTIYSYVNRTDGLWWHLNAGAGFVKHEPGVFDTGIAKDTASGQQHETLLEELTKEDPVTETVKSVTTGVKDVVTGTGATLSGVGSTLTGIGKNLGLILIAVVVVGVVFIYTGKTKAI